jgi:hypothetical protein
MGYEQGAIAQLDTVSKPQTRHAIRKTMSGPTALCGAGRIEIRLLGNFDSSAQEACPQCAELLAAA